ncbi:galactosylceramide sulfotransferase-like [Antedon mediterranea]|uniref:galactosylceramide sulfotransferase-like n=1 Tax=Antedon mediterranea TaxID=105859 RepID=UPI003AF9737A
MNGHVGILKGLSSDMAKYSFLPPLGVSIKDYKNYKYNLLGIHIRYSRPVMDAFMKPGTVYITIIREPTTQFESAFSFFELSKYMGISKELTGQQRLEEFFRKPDSYRKKLKYVTWYGMKGVPWFHAKNSQIFDLGLDHEYHGDLEVVDRYIQRLDKEFEMVVILEHLDESLVILRQLLCWSWEDILYIKQNARLARTPLTQNLTESIQHWNSVDMLLYTHFNQTLWNKVAHYGPHFQRDLNLFRTMLVQMNSECATERSGGNNLGANEPSRCKLLKRNNEVLHIVIARQRNKYFSKYLHPLFK